MKNLTILSLVLFYVALPVSIVSALVGKSIKEIMLRFGAPDGYFFRDLVPTRKNGLIVIVT